MEHHIGLGTAAIGRPHYINIRQEESKPFELTRFKQDGMAVLEFAYQQGIRYFDTAPGYGIAEELLLEWLKGKSDSAIVVATKWGYTYTANFDINAKQHEVKEHSLAKLNEQWETSMKLLPYLKMYQIHSATLESGVLENRAVLERLAALKETYNLKIGLTASGEKQVAILQKALDIEVDQKSLFDLFQVTYNMLDQSIYSIAELIKQQEKHIVIKEALANGRIFPNQTYTNYEPLYKTLQALATKYEVGVDAIALRFVIDSLAPYKVLSGASNKAHVLQNLAVNQFQLQPSEVEHLRSFGVTPKAYWSERKLLGWR